MKRAALLVIAFVMFVGCGPGLQGRWDISGELNSPEYRRLSGELHLDDEARGLATFDLGDGPSRRTPVCVERRDETTLVFSLDSANPAATSCSGAGQPLRFRGDIGVHVLTGRVMDAQGHQLGMWRAYRQGE